MVRINIHEEPKELDVLEDKKKVTAQNEETFNLAQLSRQENLEIQAKTKEDKIEAYIDSYNYAYIPGIESVEFTENNLKGFLLNRNYKDITGEWAYKFKKWGRINLISHSAWAITFLGICSFFMNKSLFTSLVHSHPLANITFFGLVCLIAFMTPLRIYARHKFDLYKSEHYFHRRITDYFLRNPDKLKEFVVEIMESPAESTYFKNPENYTSLISSLESGHRREFHKELHKFLNLYQGAHFKSRSVENFLETGEIPETVKKSNNISWAKIKHYFSPGDYFKKNRYAQYINPPSIYDDEARPGDMKNIEKLGNSNSWGNGNSADFINQGSAKNFRQSEMVKLHRDFSNDNSLYNTTDIEAQKTIEAKVFGDKADKSANHQTNISPGFKGVNNTKPSNKYLYSK